MSGNFSKTFDQLIIAAGKYVAKGYTKNLQSHASSYGWPEEIANSLNISHDGKNHGISHPENYKDVIHKLEYGTQDTQAAPALRTFILGVS
jgi:hypothetical protein